MNAFKVVIVIPSYNEANNIVSTVTQLQSYGEIVVVNDGSDDCTSDLCKKLNCSLIEHKVNRGYDCALITGLQYAQEQGFDFAVTFDADGQHNAEIISQAVELLRAGSDIVVGDRHHMQRLAESVFGCLAMWMWGVRDPLCGFKGYNFKRLPSFLDLGKYDSVGTEILMRAIRSKKGYCISQFDCRTTNRVGESTFGTGWKSNVKILVAMVKGLFVRAY